MTSIIFVYIIIIFIIVIISNVRKKTGGGRNDGRTRNVPGQMPQRPDMPANTVRMQIRTNVQPPDPVIVPRAVHTDSRCNTGVEINTRSHFDETRHPKLPEGDGLTAMRWESWFNRPERIKVIKCCYCGADNAVEAGSGNRYKCYFCWRKL